MEPDDSRLSPVLWASSCNAELTATLHSEQYMRRLAFSSSDSPSASASPSGSASGSRSGSEGESRVESPPPVAEVVSGAAAAGVLWTIGEATGGGDHGGRIVKEANGSAGVSTGDSGKAAAPRTPSAARE